MGGDLVGPLAARGIDARWVAWDDPDVDWAVDLVAVRSAWDYHRRCSDFLSWARRVERISPLLNGADVFAWNADKAYLLELADRVPVVPTALMDESSLVSGLAAGLEEYGAIVVKPRTGASGIGVVVVEEPLDERLQGLVPAPWVVQPLVGSIRTTGEMSVYVFGGRAVSQVEKLPSGTEIRIHELYGGRSRVVPTAPDTAGLGEAAVRAASRLLGTDLPYARVDMLVWDDVWAVSELELIEPGLHLDVDPVNAQRFADLVAGLLHD